MKTIVNWNGKLDPSTKINQQIAYRAVRQCPTISYEPFWMVPHENCDRISILYVR